ncbi:ribonuclease R [Candidatus Epulonipiscium viviparus]|uniref:ribonuclease R n=1 Tax=Candidatus Epulonipiscium viviparus TaxID=420336 RepID=UPI00016C0320|nr:ribonuclease R [Candidatus Epulopiscium viviparus]
MDNKKRKQTIVKLLGDPSYVPMKIKDLVTILKVPKEDRLLFENLLRELIEEHKIICTKRGKYALPTQYDMVYGIFRGTQKGFGFVTPDDGGSDIYIMSKNINGALHHDKVLCKISRGNKTEGTILKVLGSELPHIIGRYYEHKSFGFVIPDDNKFGTDIFIPKKNKNGAVEGNKVLVEVIKRDNDKSPEGRVAKILGHINDPGIDILSICYQYDLPTEFNPEVMAAVAKVPDEVPAKDKVGRVDFRDLMMVTIDGEDAKDLDDAVTLEILSDGNFRLGVHIADVTHYVPEKSALDLEAVARGTSIYLVDRVIPMLPHKLSNGICSLNAGVDRLALSCIMDIDQAGNVYSHDIVESVINVDKRMTYTAVKKILTDNDEELIEEYSEFVPIFRNMETLAQILRDKRIRRGALDFDFEETKVILDEEGHPTEIKAYERNVATKLIEEFMLVCNETVAEEYYFRELPFVYRIHEEPDAQKIAEMIRIVNSFGHTIKSRQKIHSRELQQLILAIKERPEEEIISKLILRSLKQARYNDECLGHFGLNARFYCHFTSPIRRYPDLQIHRIIKYTLKGQLKGKKLKDMYKRVSDISKQSSLMERRAEMAERETIKLKKAEFMADKIGEVFTGIINGVTSWGIYVLLPNTVEGLVHLNNMSGDYYIFDEVNFRYVGEATNTIYQIGQKVQVQLIKVDTLARSIDFKFS